MTNLQKHFVTFYSPGTFVSEATEKEIAGWDVDAAKAMAREINERHGAKPYGFRFTTRERGPDDLDSKLSKSSHLYYLGGEVRTLEQVFADNNPDEDILRSNMRNNGIKRIITNNNSWRFTAALNEDDVILEWAA